MSENTNQITMSVLCVIKKNGRAYSVLEMKLEDTIKYFTLSCGKVDFVEANIRAIESGLKHIRDKVESTNNLTPYEIKILVHPKSVKSVIPAHKRYQAYVRHLGYTVETDAFAYTESNHRIEMNKFLRSQYSKKAVNLNQTELPF